MLLLQLLTLAELVAIGAPVVFGFLWLYRRERRRRLAAQAEVKELQEVADEAVQTAIAACDDLAELQAQKGMYRAEAPALPAAKPRRPFPISHSTALRRRVSDPGPMPPLVFLVTMLAIAASARKAKPRGEKATEST